MAGVIAGIVSVVVCAFFVASSSHAYEAVADDSAPASTEWAFLPYISKLGASAPTPTDTPTATPTGTPVSTTTPTDTPTDPPTGSIQDTSPPEPIGMYHALIAGLTAAKQQPDASYADLRVVSNWELIIKQQRGEWQVKNIAHRPLSMEAVGLRSCLRSIAFAFQPTETILEYFEGASS